MNKEELKQKLEIQNPFEYFANQAYKFAKKIKLPAEFISEVLEIIKGAFGEQWICNQLERKDREVPMFRSRQHHIANCFISPSESHLVEIFELAIYIKRLIHCENLDQVLKQMKDSRQYSTGLLQLAFAYRFLKLGARNIKFEPEALGCRKGDIYFEIKSISYMVECFVPRYNYPPRTSLDLMNSVSAIFGVIKSMDGRMRICIRLRESITPSDRREIEKVTKQLIKEIDSKKQVSGITKCAEILVEDISDLDLDEDTDFPKENKGTMELYGGADWGINNQMVNLDKIQEVRNGTLKDKKRLSRLFVWEPKEDKNLPTISKRTEELTKKIEKKLSQTRVGKINTRRIVIAQVGEAHKRDKETYTAFKKIQNKIIKSHTNVAILILVSRDWMENFRYQYRGVFLMGREEDALSAELFDKWNKLEQEGHVLQDWR